MIITQTPASLRRPGAYPEFNFTTGAPTLINQVQTVVIIAEMLATGGTATVETPIQVFSAADADSKFGQGSLAALMCRKAFAQGARSPSTPPIFCCPPALPGTGTKATETITITGPATAAGNLSFSVADRLVTIGVASGDLATAIAANIKAQLDTLKPVLPIIATVAGAVVTCTFTTIGANGNDLTYTLASNGLPAGVGLTFAQSVAGSGVTNVTNALAALYDRRYHGVALANHATADLTAIVADKALAWGVTAQNYRLYFVGDTGSIGTAQTLQAAANDYGALIIECEQCPALPGELAVAAAVAKMSRANPNANLDGEVLLCGAPPGSYAFLDSEVETCLSGGITPCTPDGTGYIKIELLTTTQTTYAGAPFEPLRDVAYPWTAAYHAEQISQNFAQKFKQQVEDDDLLLRVRDMIINVDRAMEAQNILRNVDTTLQQVVVEYAPSPAGRIAAVCPFIPAGPLHQGVFVNTMYMGS